VICAELDDPSRGLARYLLRSYALHEVLSVRQSQDAVSGWLTSAAISGFVFRRRVLWTPVFCAAPLIGDIAHRLSGDLNTVCVVDVEPTRRSWAFTIWEGGVRSCAYSYDWASGPALVDDALFEFSAIERLLGASPGAALPDRLQHPMVAAARMRLDQLRRLFAQPALLDGPDAAEGIDHIFREVVGLPELDDVSYAWLLEFSRSDPVTFRLMYPDVSIIHGAM
jgi:hypothetical protein